MKRVILTALMTGLLITPMIAPTMALAHLDPSGHGSFMAGATHPIFGADHVLAMLSVGLWAALLGGRALWILPLIFLGGMSSGFGAALLGIPLPAVEPMILASVVILGLVVALSVQMPPTLAGLIVAAFSLFHGHAHGAEMGGASALQYLAGFVLATMGLHLVGLVIGLLLVRFSASGVLRGGGGIVAALGAWLVVAG